MIHKLESAGLGYHVTADETEDKLGELFFFCNMVGATATKTFVLKNFNLIILILF